MDINQSDSIKLAAGVATGYFTADELKSAVEVNDDLTIEKFLKFGETAVGGGIVTSIVSNSAMEEIDVSGSVNFVFDKDILVNLV